METQNVGGVRHIHLDAILSAALFCVGAGTTRGLGAAEQDRVR